MDGRQWITEGSREGGLPMVESSPADGIEIWKYGMDPALAAPTARPEGTGGSVLRRAWLLPATVPRPPGPEDAPAAPKRAA